MVFIETIKHLVKAQNTQPSVLCNIALEKILQHLGNTASEKFQEHLEKILIAYNKPA